MYIELYLVTTPQHLKVHKSIFVWHCFVRLLGLIEGISFFLIVLTN